MEKERPTNLESKMLSALLKFYLVTSRQIFGGAGTLEIGFIEKLTYFTEKFDEENVRKSYFHDEVNRQVTSQVE